MLTRIISLIMSVIMLLFPSLGKKKSMSNETVAKAVIYSVENKDPSAIEEVMCKSMKEKYKDITGEINNMLSYIEGDIESITWESYGGYSESDGKGKSVSQNLQDYLIITTEGVYCMLTTVEKSNSYSPDELGLRDIFLCTQIKNTDPNVKTEYVFGEKLYQIEAPEGYGKLHS